MKSTVKLVWISGPGMHKGAELITTESEIMQLHNQDKNKKIIQKYFNISARTLDVQVIRLSHGRS